MKRFLTGIGLTLGLVASLAAGVFAQEQPPAPQGGQGQVERRGPWGPKGHRGPGAGRHGHGMRAFGQLNLTDAQREQIRALRESHRQSTQAQRDELRQIFETRRQGGQLTTEQQARVQQLHAELREAGKRMHDEIVNNVLTAEQRARLEQLKQEREARREQMRENNQQ